MNQSISVSKIKIVISLLCLALWTVLIISLYAICKLLKLPSRTRVAMWFHKGILCCFNIECRTKGELVTSRPTLYIANHISYMDIFVLGSTVPGTFIAKTEVASWPLFGTLGKLQDTLFIERKGRKVANQIKQIQDYLASVSNLILFPEGTSHYGTYVAPFHSSFFQSADSEADNIIIQPISVAYTHYKNQLMDRQTRDFYAWYKPRKILPHLLNGLGLGRARVELTFHAPLKISDFASRKECAKHCEALVRQGLLDSMGIDKEIRD